MLRSGKNLFVFFSSVQYSILPSAVCCGAVYTCNHTRFIDRFMMTEGGDPLSFRLNAIYTFGSSDMNFDRA